jgi:ABC-type dipeptide/oligopeptide/nickel transport system permease component
MTPHGHRPLVWGAVSLVATALLVVWLTDFAINAAPLDDLTLRLLLAGKAPFQGLSLPEALWTAVSRSAILVGASLAAAIGIGVLAGAAYAFSRWGFVRAVAWAVGTVGASLPSFFWAMLLQLVVVLVYIRTQRVLAPISGGFGVDEHLILPTIALAMRPAAYIFRTTATALDEARHAPHVITAWAKGLDPSVVASRHVARNAAPAVFAGMALGAKTALSSLAIVEFVFTWNGAGYGFILSVATGNVAFASAIALVFAVALALMGALVALATRVMNVSAR